MVKLAARDRCSWLERGSSAIGIRRRPQSRLSCHPYELFAYRRGAFDPVSGVQSYKGRLAKQARALPHAFDATPVKLASSVAEKFAKYF